MTGTIDLNCDVGEIPALIADGTEDRLLAQVTSANIACGGHAGDDATMEATLRSALRHGCAVGAHPGYDDREHFGRRRLDLPLERVVAMVRDQVTRIAAMARAAGTTLAHVKPHGALYNAAADDRDLASAIARGVRAATPHAGAPALVGLAGSASLEVCRNAGFRVADEAFADRRYEPDGRLRSRALPGALLEDPDEAAAQAVSIARDGRVTASDGSILEVTAATLCLHGDTPGAVRIAAAVRAALAGAGIAVAPLAGRTPSARPTHQP
ncbi:MAG TPA: 5-oxoprolinase subunit PxpA [Candidatus Polarisedimenticolia bacterium]|nr:5-oxoprolinase subunit PxpA [Candidatus Polarisedimenticolia bacterium]